MSTRLASRVALLVATLTSLARAQSTVATVAAPSDSSGTPTPESTPKSKPAPNAAPVVAGVRIGGLLQVHYLDGSAGTPRTFRVRRMELSLSGTPARAIGWTVMVDAAKAVSLGQRYATVSGSRVVSEDSVNPASQILQDANVAWTFARGHTLTVGQQRVPLGAEGTRSAATLETIERAQFLSDRRRGGGLGDVRDAGAVVRGAFASPHRPLAIDYAAGVLNGLGELQNAMSTDGRHAIAGRLVLRTRDNAIRVGASGATEGARTTLPRRDRAGTELQLTRGATMARAEYATGVDGTTHRRGMYLLATERIAHGLTAVARIDDWDPDVHAESEFASARTRELVLGATRSFGESAGAQLQANVVRRTYAHDLAPSTTLLRVNLQASW